MSENVSETSPKQSGVETQCVPKLAELAQRSCNQIETNGKNKEERKSDECTKEMKTSKLESSTVIDEQISDAAGLETTELGRDVVSPEISDVGAQVGNADSQISDFDARLSQVDAQMVDVIDLQTLADTCAEEEYIDVLTVDEEPCESFHFGVIQNQVPHNDEKTETKRPGKEKEDKKTGSHSLDKDKETILNAIPEQQQLQEQQQQQQQHAIADVIIQSKSTPFCEANLVNLKMPLSDEKDDIKAQNNEPTNRSSSLNSQEIIQEKLSEILAIVSKEEWNEPRLSQTKFRSPSQIAENADKCFGDPIKTSDTEIKIKSDKHTPDGLENNCVEEKVPKSLANNDTDSQNTSKIENIEIEQYEEMQVDNPAVTEKVKDSENKQVSNCVNSDKNSQKASSKGSQKIGGSENLQKEKRMERNEDVKKDEEEVPRKVATSPEQEVPHEMVTTPVIPPNESQKLKTTEEKVVASSNSFEDQSYTEEFRALEELLPTDDMGLFDDVLLSKPQSIR